MVSGSRPSGETSGTFPPFSSKAPNGGRRNPRRVLSHGVSRVGGDVDRGGEKGQCTDNLTTALRDVREAIALLGHACEGQSAERPGPRCSGLSLGSTRVTRRSWWSPTSRSCSISSTRSSSTDSYLSGSVSLRQGGALATSARSPRLGSHRRPRTHAARKEHGYARCWPLDTRGGHLDRRAPPRPRGGQIRVPGFGGLGPRR